MDISFQIENTTIHTINFYFGKMRGPIPDHSHGSSCYEIHYVTGGEGQLIVDGRSYRLVPNLLYITGPHVNHTQLPVPDNPMEEYCIYIKVGAMDRSAGNFPILDSFMENPFWLGSDSQNILSLFTELGKEIQSKDIGYPEKTKSLLCQIMVAIVRNYKRGSDMLNPRMEQSVSDKKSLIIEEYFLYEYATLSLNGLADKLSLGVRQTERILQEYYGKNFQQMKLDAKMSNAAVLLREDHRISRVAEKLGFSSLEHFSSSFKKYYNMTPSQFKKQLSKC